MPKKNISEKERRKCLERAKKEFPNCKSLQEIHYIRYLLELEWSKMSPEEIMRDIKEGAKRLLAEGRNK